MSPEIPSRIVRTAQILMEQSSKEPEFEVAWMEAGEIEPLRLAILELGYQAEIVSPGDRLRITRP